MKSKIGCNPAVAERFQERFNYLRSKALVHKQKDLAKLIGATEANVSRLLSGDDRYTTKSMIARINHASGYPFSEDYLLRGEGTLLQGGVSTSKNFNGMDDIGRRISTLMDYIVGDEHGRNKRFADKVGVTEFVVSNWIRRNPGINVIRRIKEAIPEVSMPWLLSGEGDMLVETGSISPLREAYEFLRSMGIVRTQTDVAVKTGYNKSAVSHALHGTEGYVTNRFVAAFNEAFGGLFNEVYLLRGEGTLLSDPESSVSERELREACEEEPSTLGSRTLLQLPVIPTTLEAGIGRGILYERDDTQDLEDVYAAYASVPVFLDRETSHRYQLFCVRDDSMMDGTRDSLCIGDILLCREVLREDWTHGLIGRYPNVVVVTEEGVLLRRLTKHDRKQETISLHSLNGGDEDLIIALQDVKAFFYVERLIERHLSTW